MMYVLVDPSVGSGEKHELGLERPIILFAIPQSAW